jgi:plastocyanin
VIRTGGLAAGLLAAAVLLPFPASADQRPRPHRIKLPEPELPRSLAVDEFEWGLRPSKRLVAAGLVRMRVYNRGQDDHNLVVRERDGTPRVVSLKAGESGTLTARLAPGSYTLVCSLFAGTAQSHEQLGMRATLKAR